MAPGSYTLTLAGYGQEYEALQQYAFNTLKLHDQQVRFVYRPAKELILNYYQESDLFIFPSSTDTQAIVLAEAMAQGLPVVAIDGPGQRDIICQEHNGFIVSGKELLCHTIERITHNPNLFEVLQKNAWITSHKYLPEVIAQKTLNFYTLIQENHNKIP